MEKEEAKFRVLMFPWLAHGHIIPFLQLSKHLSSTQKFHIYFCSTAINLDTIRTNKDLADASIELVELWMPLLPELPPELHSTKNLPPSLLLTLLKTFQESSSSFSDILDSLKPDLLIYDLMQLWAPKLALSRGIPSVFFAASGAAAYSFSNHLYTGGTSSTFPYPAIYLMDHERIKLRSQIEQQLKDADKKFAFGNFSLSSDIILMKTCRGVEGKYIDYLSSSCKKQIVPTGPLIANGADYDDEKQLSEIMQWLSLKKNRSTVYISFGSEYFLSKAQIGEIARGLELCCTNFIWLVRFPVEEKRISIEEAMPEGFLDQVKERGLVFGGWAPQTKILAHPSVGGFVSHCGWSSTMESMYFSVPIIAMPMKSEQPLNARLAVEAGVGVEVGKGSHGQYTGEELAKAISKVISDETSFSRGLRDRAERLSMEMKGKEEQEASEAAAQLWKICVKNKQGV